MTRHFTLGDGARVDLDSLVRTRLLVQGNSGSGKSWCVRRVLEQTYGKLQHLVIDPEGEFSSLREKFDYIVAAPKGGDVVAHPRTAALLAEKLLECRTSAVLDILELDAAERALFVRRFLEALLDAPRELWHPVLVVVDEAQTFCPEKGTGEAESTAAMLSLATKGRKRGFCAVFATQRLSMFHKSAAAECNNKLIGRTSLDDDLKRAAKELGMSPADATAKLRSLDPKSGEWYAYGPAISSTPRLVVVGPVETTHPEAGSPGSFVAPPPSATVRATLAKLTDLPAQAEERAKTVEDLNRQVADLRRKLTIAEKAQPAPTPAPPPVEVAVLDEPARATLEMIREEMNGCRDKLRLFGDSLDDVAEAIRAATSARSAARPIVLNRAPASAPYQPRACAPVFGRERKTAEPNGGLSEPEQRVLDSIRWFESVGVERPRQSAAASGAEYAPNGSSWRSARSKLSVRGLIEHDADAVWLTSSGRDAAREPEDAPTTVELHRKVLGRLSEPERRVLEPLLGAWPDWTSQEQAAVNAGYEPDGSSWRSARSKLSVASMIEVSRAEGVKASDFLFLERR